MHPDPARAVVPAVDRLAVLRANGLGDYVVAQPALAALRAAYPAAEITLLGAPHVRALVEDRDGPCDRFLPVPSLPGVGVGAPYATPELVEAWCAEQRAYGYDLAVQLHGGGRNSNALLLRLGAGTTVGSATVDAPKPDRWVPYTAYQHDVLRWLEVVACAGARMTRLEPEITCTAEDLAASYDVLPGTGQPLVTVHPGATDARRCYPEDRLGVLAAELADRGARVVVLGGDRDAERVQRVVAGAGRPLESVVGGLGLGALVGTLRRSALFVGNDSGPRHLAAAVGTPTAAVFSCLNLADVAPLFRTWHRVEVDWDSECLRCGERVLDGDCGHSVSATHGVPLEQARAMVLPLWEQVVAAGRQWREVAPAGQASAA